MSRNRYLAVARLATHPAFRWPGHLKCPICGAETTRVAEYNRDFLAHDPDGWAAWRFLSGRAYDRYATRRGWPTSDKTVEGNAFEVFGEGMDRVTAHVTVALECEGPGCGARFIPNDAAAGSVKATRDQAATCGWTYSKDDGDRCAPCAARIAGQPAPKPLFELPREKS